MSWKSEVKQVFLGCYMAAVLALLGMMVSQCYSAAERRRDAYDEAQLKELREINRKLGL
jgi:TRAP-type C4-dicarboxylate transport system permease large subunit